MIFGIGTDIVSVSRMQIACDKHGRRFAEKILTDFELVEFDKHIHPHQYLAKRFAMKEALVKALGTGLRQSVTLHDFTIQHTELGKPIIVYSEKLNALLSANKICRSHISVSDETDYASAFAILECD